MNDIAQNETGLNPKEQETSDILLWIKKLDAMSLVPPRNKERILQTVQESKSSGVPIPLILSLCPAITNLHNPNGKSQTRELTPLKKDNPRLIKTIEEIVSFMAVTQRLTGQSTELFLIFANRLEPLAEKMFTNLIDFETITKLSLEGIRAAFFEFDQSNPGLLQKEKIKIPKVWKQTDLQSRLMEREIAKRSLEILSLKQPHFNLWLDNIQRTKTDETFVATGWQTQESAKTIWDRILFMLAQCMVDGEMLPKIMDSTFVKRFRQGMPPPIFISSTTRTNGILLEMDGFTFLNNIGVVAPFKNIGRWTDSPNESPWNLDNLDDILKAR